MTKLKFYTFTFTYSISADREDMSFLEEKKRLYIKMFLENASMFIDEVEFDYDDNEGEGYD